MAVQPLSASVTCVNEQVGASFRARRARLRMTQEEIGKRAGLDADTVSKAERGLNVWPSTVGAIDEALDHFERLRGNDLPSQVETVQARPIGDPAEGMVEFEITGNFGVKAVVKGPVANMAELQEAARRLIADMGGDRPHGDDRSRN